MESKTNADAAPVDAVVRRGQWYRIRKRYDNGGAPLMHVLKVNRHSVRVQHCRSDRTPWPPRFRPSSNIERVSLKEWESRMKYWLLER